LAQNNLLDAQTQVTDARSDLAQAQATAENARNQLTATREALTESMANLGVLRTEMEQADAELAAVRTDNTSLEASVVGQTVRIAELEAALAKKKKSQWFNRIKPFILPAGGVAVVAFAAYMFYTGSLTIPNLPNASWAATTEAPFQPFPDIGD